MAYVDVAQNGVVPGTTRNKHVANAATCPKRMELTEQWMDRKQNDWQAVERVCMFMFVDSQRPTTTHSAWRWSWCCRRRAPRCTPWLKKWRCPCRWTSANSPPAQRQTHLYVAFPCTSASWSRSRLWGVETLDSSVSIHTGDGRSHSQLLWHF